MAGNDEKDAEKRRLRDEVAALAEQVAGLRQELALSRAGHHCCSHLHCNWGHCGCFTWHGYSGTVTYPHTFTVTSGGNVSGYGGGGGGYNPGSTTLSLGN